MYRSISDRTLDDDRDVLAVMATAGIVTIDVQQAQYEAPANSSAEAKQGAALKQERTVNPCDTVLLYETVDAARS